MPQLSEPIFRPASDQSLLVTLGSEISLPVHRRVVHLLQAIAVAEIPGLVNLHPAYCSILIRFNSLMTSHDALEDQVRALAAADPGDETGVSPVIEIPVRYGGEFGPDLDGVAEMCGLSARQVVELHASTEYTAYFLGFVPGFAYLGSVPDAIRVPRLQTPRKRVPAGSVAMASDHTAVYPISTPGGWRLIGRTDVPLFDPSRRNLTVLHAGDRVRFRPVAT